jgi:hypothetical protein
MHHYPKNDPTNKAHWRTLAELEMFSLRLYWTAAACVVATVAFAWAVSTLT